MDGLTCSILDFDVMSLNLHFEFQLLCLCETGESARMHSFHLEAWKRGRRCDGMGGFAGDYVSDLFKFQGIDLASSITKLHATEMRMSQTVWNHHSWRPQRWLLRDFLFSDSNIGGFLMKLGYNFGPCGPPRPHNGWGRWKGAAKLGEAL